MAPAQEWQENLCSILKKKKIGQKYWNWVHSAMSNISLSAFAFHELIFEDTW